MNEKKTTELQPRLIRRLEWMAQWARLCLLLERLWPRLWGLLILTSLFVTLVLFDVLPLLSASLHTIVLGVFALSWLILFAKILQEMDWPNFRDGVHRLEKQSGLENQPLQALLDAPALSSNNKVAQAIWIAHQDRMANAFDQIKLKWPKSYLYQRDPYSLRAGIIIVLLLGGLEARFDLPERIERAFFPMDKTTASKNWTVQAWITPSAHTNWGAIYLTSNMPPPPEPIEIPQHSKVLVRIEGQRTRDDMTLKSGHFEEPFEALGRGSFNLETKLDQGQHLSVLRDGKPLHVWPISIIMDTPPVISLRGKPRGSVRGHLSAAFEAQDDYGLKEAVLSIRHATDDTSEEIILRQSIQGKKSAGSFRDNLSSHPWAGQKVILTPRITDNNDQHAFGEAQVIILPERRFSHPTAKTLVHIRKSLYQSGQTAQLKAKIQLAALLQDPAKLDHQVSVYLGLRVAEDRIRPHVSDFDIATVQTILWESAVHLEEGVSGTTRDRLEDMSRQMQDLLNNPQDKAAMEALFEQMTQSLNQFMQQMSQVQNPFEGMEEFINADNAQLIGQNEMMDMLSQAREMMRAGDVAGAMAMMEKFRDVLSRMAMQTPPDPKMAEQVQQTMKLLKSIRDDQEELLRTTFRRARNSSIPSLESTKGAILEAEEQQKLVSRLQDVFKQFQKMSMRSPKSLRGAEHEMKQGAKFLQKGLDERAIQSERRAVEALIQALTDSAQAMAQKMGMMPQMGQLPGFDPLGRGRNGRMDSDDGNVIPTQAETHRAREIMQELYRRAGEKNRPELELKYIERLLDRF